MCLFDCTKKISGSVHTGDTIRTSWLPLGWEQQVPTPALPLPLAPAGPPALRWVSGAAASAHGEGLRAHPARLGLHGCRSCVCMCLQPVLQGL